MELSKVTGIGTKNISLLDMSEIKYLYDVGYKTAKKEIKKIKISMFR